MSNNQLSSLQLIIGQKQFFSEFSSFDEHMRRTREKIPTRDERSEDNIKVAWLLFDVLRDNFFMMRVIGLKLAEIGLGYMQSRTAENATVQIALSRAFLEHTASLAFQANKLRSTVEGLSKHPDLERLTSKTNIAINELRKLYYGSSSEKDRDFVHVNDMIPKLEKKLIDIQSRYDHLCDYVHPNYKSNKLVSEGNFGTGKLGLPYSDFKEELGFADSTVEMCATASIEYQKEMSRSLLQVDSYIKIACIPGTKTTQIFSVRGAYIGDGKSPDTAIYFNKARTSDESHAALDQYVKKNGIVMLEQQPGWKQDGFWLEAYKTNKGIIWFKLRITNEFNG